MILAHKTMEYFKLLEAKVSQAMTRHSNQMPYPIDDDPVIRNFEIMRTVWIDELSVDDACKKFGVSRYCYYKNEKNFIAQGASAFFPDIKPAVCSPELERLVVTISRARPSLSQQAMLRIAEAIPATSENAGMPGIDLISQILASHGRSASALPADLAFWQHIQRALDQLNRMKERAIPGRNRRQRRKTFFKSEDTCLTRLELLRALFHGAGTIRDVCKRFGMAQTSYYRVVRDYRLFGPWAVIPANMPGKESMKAETELNIILLKLGQPYLSAMKTAETMKLKCSRYAVNRVFARWGLADKSRKPIAMNHLSLNTAAGDKFKPAESAWHLYSEKSLLQSRRINRHFESICKKMRTREYHMCDPGPLLLAPFVNELGIAQAMEVHGSPGPRGKDLSSLALLNVFRILGGYRRINHLSDNRDRSVALASGLGMFGSRSRYYRDTMDFKFEQLHALRCDLIARARELKIVEGTKIAFDFHFKEFFGSRAREKGFGKGPDKSGNLVPGFRPHVAWDLAANTILSITYYHGGVRAPGIVEQYCERHIFPLFDPLAIREI